ncbi:efflux RND transporter periplasmic adaptor subunit [Bryobacter aggregatus]|uniref:efflux RND transporter periplasmic adaptor subunit n=1 Tax=Bryobacter aggregatus TaxID=360054 RepID=UPI0004E17947|nr:efflux RND transporter periplasmic adaptor subunit [Bryobacter aggregatus]
MRAQITFIAALSLWSCGEKAPPQAVNPIAKEAATAPTGYIEIAANSPKLEQIKVSAVVIAEMPTEEFTAPGKIEVNPNRVSRVLLPVAGRIAEVFVKFGDSVQKNDPLLTVESPEADAAASNQLQADASVTQAQANLNKAQADYDRANDLFKADAVAKKEVLTAENALLQAKTALEQSKVAREQSMSRLEMLGLKPGNFRQRITLRAPLAGKVTEFTVVAGEFRNDLSAPLMTIADLSTVWVASDVPETAIRLVKPNERFDLTLVAYPGEVFRSRVARISDKVDPNSRTIEVWAELSNPQNKLKPAMFGQIRHVESLETVPVIPASAMIQMEGRTAVFRELQRGRYQLTDVITGSRNGDLISIRKGLNAGQRVVTDGAMLLRGM